MKNCKKTNWFHKSQLYTTKKQDLLMKAIRINKKAYLLKKKQLERKIRSSINRPVKTHKQVSDAAHDLTKLIRVMDEELQYKREHSITKGKSKLCKNLKNLKMINLTIQTIQVEQESKVEKATPGYNIIQKPKMKQHYFSLLDPTKIKEQLRLDEQYQQVDLDNIPDIFSRERLSKFTRSEFLRRENILNILGEKFYRSKGFSKLFLSKATDTPLLDFELDFDKDNNKKLARMKSTDLAEKMFRGPKVLRKNFSVPSSQYKEPLKVKHAAKVNRRNIKEYFIKRGILDGIKNNIITRPIKKRINLLFKDLRIPTQKKSKSSQQNNSANYKSKEIKKIDAYHSMLGSKMRLLGVEDQFHLTNILVDKFEKNNDSETLKDIFQRSGLRVRRRRRKWKKKHVGKGSRCHIRKRKNMNFQKKPVFKVKRPQTSCFLEKGSNSSEMWFKSQSRQIEDKRIGNCLNYQNKRNFKDTLSFVDDFADLKNSCLSEMKSLKKNKRVIVKKQKKLKKKFVGLKASMMGQIEKEDKELIKTLYQGELLY